MGVWLGVGLLRGTDAGRARCLYCGYGCVSVWAGKCVCACARVCACVRVYLRWQTLIQLPRLPGLLQRSTSGESHNVIYPAQQSSFSQTMLSVRTGAVAASVCPHAIEIVAVILETLPNTARSVDGCIDILVGEQAADNEMSYAFQHPHEVRSGWKFHTAVCDVQVRLPSRECICVCACVRSS